MQAWTDRSARFVIWSTRVSERLFLLRSMRMEIGPIPLIGRGRRMANFGLVLFGELKRDNPQMPEDDRQWS